MPSTVHCDHLILARSAPPRTCPRRRENKEVYAFLESVSARYGIGFWKPGSGIIHQVVLENYAFPGGMMIGTDSHTPNGGGLGMLASASAAPTRWTSWRACRGTCCSPSSSASAHRQALGLDLAQGRHPQARRHPHGEGRHQQVVEYFGPGCASICCTGKGTITNMGAELGATTSVFPFDARMATYLRATRRAAMADLPAPTATS